MNFTLILGKSGQNFFLFVVSGSDLALLPSRLFLSAWELGRWLGF